jgi:DNA polymerase-3 subunit alpha
MKDSIKKLKPDRIDDLMALSALYRPGPMDNIPTYIACKHGRQEVKYVHPMLEGVLKDTYGVIIYQEQVLEVARVLAGYSLGSADLLRRAMGKKIKAEMDAQQEMFVQGAMKNGITKDKAQEIFALVEKFAGYGFNKAHAASYAVISYQTAYLKAHYPIYFLTAALNLDICDHDKIALFVDDALKFNIKVIASDINTSFGYFQVQENSIISAFGAVKGVTPNFGDEIARIRQDGPFTSIVDFIERISNKLMNRKYLESLIKAGCFDSLHANRLQLINSIDRLLSYSNSYHQDKLSSQLSLLGGLVSCDILVAAEGDMPYLEKSLQEVTVLGYFARFHPVNFYQEELSLHHIINSRNLANLKSGNHKVRIAAAIQKKDARISARGRYLTMQLSDPYGLFEVSIFNEETIRLYNDFLIVASCAIFTCEVQKDDFSIRMIVTAVENMQEFSKNIMHTLKLHVPKADLNKVIVFLQSKVAPEKNNAQISIMLEYQHSFLLNLTLPPIFHLEMSDKAYLQQYVL